MNSEPQAKNPHKTSVSSGETLQDLTKRTAKVMAEARKEVDRARETLHDQILPSAQSGVEGDYEDEDEEVRREDTRGAWPNWM